MLRLWSLGGMLLILLLAGCSQSGSIAVTEKDKQEIERYIRQEVMSPNFGGEIFSAYEILGSDENKGELYLWALIQEYYKEGTGIEQGTGMSVPMVLKIDQSKDSFEVISHTLPRDGSLYAEDIKNLFPYLAGRKALDHPDKVISELIEEAEAEAEQKLK
ncbi:hypothetical protein M3204_19375 [Mesobacillus subterraneus]|uniref:hypothetical protein n=1 Tax=Mesobacillus subterraneus TaxID=285983 RepID=UPI00203ACBC9|nr:hypothetical protein [Mesobacillus subterraneus]MCM3666586.1 hypothetical protein [Mesobacillus subterraneus]MCM3685954.1 hypothetical protein [Mesobacillus subterraneus]